METTKCELCGSLNRVRGIVLQDDRKIGPVWRTLVVCTVCGRKAYRNPTQAEMMQVEAMKNVNRKTGKE